MTHISHFILAYIHGKSGATAIEYGLIAAGISLAVAASIYAFGDSLGTLLYDDLPNALSGNQ